MDSSYTREHNDSAILMDSSYTREHNDSAILMDSSYEQWWPRFNKKETKPCTHTTAKPWKKKEVIIVKYVYKYKTMGHKYDITRCFVGLYS